MAGPRPVPPYRRVVETSACANRLAADTRNARRRIQMHAWRARAAFSRRRRPLHCPLADANGLRTNDTGAAMANAPVYWIEMAAEAARGEFASGLPPAVAC